MKLVFAVLSLWAVAVFALRESNSVRYRYNEVEDRDVEPFKAGQTFKYQLDTQISSGIASISDQHAVTRLRAEVQLHFQSERLVSLKLKEIEIGTSNEEIQNPEKVQPFQLFKDVQIKSDELRQLEYPCTFDYADGLVERIRFHAQDQPWSKNIKKSVLNMLQLNLKQRQGQDIQLEQQEAWRKERELVNELSKANENKQQHRLFVMPEMTLEGECQVSYTVTPMNARNKFNSYYDDQVSRDSLKMFNVTKTVDFHRCNKIADIRYGPKIEKPCENCTNQQELEERKLDRTTIMRHVVVGTQEQYGIKKVETVSHYIFKMLNVEEETPMHTVVAGRLSYMKVENDRSEIERELKQLTITNNGESLLYSTEWDEQEKRFYMYGDDEFKQQTPFEKVNDKVGKVESLMKKLIGMWSDKKTGIDSEATLVYTRLVDFLRMCSIEDLKTIYMNVKEGSSRFTDAEQRKAKDILIDVLSNAGTHNTIKVLAEKIKKSEIEPARATRAIYQLKSLPAPSEKIIKLLTEVCESEVCERHGSCAQVCWLNVGTILGDLCEEDRTVDDALEQRKPLCHMQLKKDSVDKAIRQFEKYDTRYAKIVVLKALGNAGLEPSVYELEKIIRNIREDPLVRMQAIDSLRRLRAVMPQKIQRVLLPIFQNTRERPEVRMMAASQILATFPENPIVDQIGYTLLREPSRQVKSYVYKAMKELSQSPIEVEKELAEHLKTLLKLADITEEDEETLIRGSRYYRVPVYSKAKKEGLFFDLESMVGTDNFLPKHLTAGMDTVFNGLFQKNAMELSFTQEDIEQWFEKLMDVYMESSWSSSYERSDRSSSERSSKSNRASRLSRRDSSEADNDFRKIVTDLGLKRRESRIGSDSIRSSNRAPYAMLNYRYGDVDYALLPLEEEILPASLKKLLIQGQRPSVSDLEDLAELIRGRPFSAQLAMNVLENSIKIPTSAGFPIRMWHVVPVLASVEGQVKPELRNVKEEIRAEIKLHPMIAVTHLKRVEVWSPIVNSGVDSTRTASINLPITAELKINYDQQTPTTFKLAIDVPETKYRVFNLHTLPLTYTSELEWMQQRTPVVRRIENRNLVHRSQHVEKLYGKRDFGMPVKVSGEVHVPHRFYYSDIAHMLLSTENHLHVEFVPDSETPRQITLQGEASFFNADNDRTQHRGLKDFHSKSRFDRDMDSEFENDDEDEKRYNKFLDEYEPSKMYNHRVKLEVKTEGAKPKQAAIELRAGCDNQHRFAKASLKVKRSPLHSLDETNQWELNTDAQVVLPEVHSDLKQYKRGSDKPQRLVAQINTEWGSDRKQKIYLNINGEQARNQVWIQKLRDSERINTPEGQRVYQQLLQKTAFLNKYDISAEYGNLAPETKSTLNSMATMLKSWNFWNTKTEFKSGRDSLTEGQATATIVIDPITHEHANITLKTPVETVRIDSMVLPMKAKPFKLVKPGQIQQSVDSFTDIIRDYAVESRQECKVNNGKVRSFDDVIFKAPMSKCYTVLAKDCSNSENPRFAVMMKKVSSNEKALKVITRREVIEIEPKSGKLQVKINGEREDNEETLEQYGIDYTKNMVRIANRDITVRFDGEEASLKVSPSFKNTQCGLCGHYDDDSEDEFRMPNNELTSDIKSYHKSYSLVDDECRRDSEDTYNQEEYKQLKHRREYDQDEEYGQDKKQQKRRRNDNYEQDPIEKTEVMEYNHKICFSIKPVKTCPEGSYPEEQKEQKVSFSCMDRSSTEARRLLREARRTNRPITDLPTKSSFTETLRVPSTCTVY